MTLYNLRSDGTITKWNADGNIEAQYLVSDEGCTCPAGHRYTCRHRQMLPDLLPLADTHWFLDWDHGRTVVDFVGTPKSVLDAFLSGAVPVGPALLEEDTITAEAIEALPDGLEKDYQHEMQAVEQTVAQDTPIEGEIITPADLDSDPHEFGQNAKDVTPASWRRL